MFCFINYPSWIKPEIFSFLPIRWYALMYIVAFGIAYLLFKYQVKHDGLLVLSNDDIDYLFMCCIILLLIFAHLFSVFVYIDAK